MGLTPRAHWLLRARQAIVFEDLDHLKRVIDDPALVRRGAGARECTAPLCVRRTWTRTA